MPVPTIRESHRGDPLSQIDLCARFVLFLYFTASYSCPPAPMARDHALSRAFATQSAAVTAADLPTGIKSNHEHLDNTPTMLPRSFVDNASKPHQGRSLLPVRLASGKGQSPAKACQLVGTMTNDIREITSIPDGDALSHRELLKQSPQERCVQRRLYCETPNCPLRLDNRWPTASRLLYNGAGPTIVVRSHQLPPFPLLSSTSEPHSLSFTTPHRRVFILARTRWSP